MTKVNWYPVVVDDYGKIKKGEKPGVEMDYLYVTLDNGSVEKARYFDDADGFGDGYPHVQFEHIVAWAYIEFPEPYQPRWRR